MTENKSIAIVHYTYPPVIGGVERVVQAHARILTRNGYRVKVISGAGEKEEGIEVKVIPCLRSLAIFDQELDKGLKKGKRLNRFYDLKEEIFYQVEKELAGIDICIIHNIMTMHFNLPLTCALNELIEKLHSRTKFYLWCHDSTLINPIYQKDIPYPDQYPWNLLSRFNPQVDYIAISELRRRELAELFSVDAHLIQVIPAGVDVKSLLNISDSIWNLAWDKGFFESDLVMFFPSRMLQRKNYELGIRVLEEMKKRGKRCKFVITAPPYPHNPAAAQYFNYLHQLSKELGVEEEVIFLFDLKQRYELKLDYKEVKDLYSLCDVLFITSTQEGFGIPLLEAGVKRIPIICTNIEPLSEVVQNYALKIDLKQDIPTITEKILNYVEFLPPLSMFKRVVSRYSWEAIYKNYLEKLVNKSA